MVDDVEKICRKSVESLMAIQWTILLNGATYSYLVGSSLATFAMAVLRISSKIVR